MIDLRKVVFGTAVSDEQVAILDSNPVPQHFCYSGRVLMSDENG
jgi:hypothetical protein